ncbi:MAG: BREX system P-loop protein BrxC, partial [Chromatiaceae bacterium]|nr:BREX system P-loop protein BrxC [Candidatus Thioaporhodococcus sediminis]
MAIATATGTEYRLQTAESSAWHDEYRKQVAELSANTQRLEMERIDLLKAAYREALKGVHLTQGQIKEARTLTPCFDEALPADAAKQIIAWFRDGWSSSEAEIKGDARNAGPTSPAIFVFLPAQSRNELRSAIIEHQAAQLTLDTRGLPTTPEGQDARSAMETRRNDAARRILQIVKTLVQGAQVYQGGGQTVDGNDLTEKLQAAGKASMVRLYRDYDTADQVGWDKVIERARKGETQPLQPLKHGADTDQHPVCAAILKHLGAGKKGSDLRDHFKAPPFGWPQDVIDGALYALVASGHVLALTGLGKPVDAKGLERKQITQSSFKPETVTISPVQKIQIRKIFQEVGIGCQPGQEIDQAPGLLRKLRDLAARAGGEAPQPAPPEQRLLGDLEALTGNALLAELYSQRETLIQHGKDWQASGERIGTRWPVWSLLQDLLGHAQDLAPHQELDAEAEEIRKQRALLAAHDPVQALLDKTVDLLRTSLNHHVQAYEDSFDAELTALEQEGDWRKLSPEQRETILARQDLDEAVAIDVSTPESIFDELERCSLAQWADRTQALRGRYEQARLAAAKLLEPKVQRVDLPRRTLKDEAELAEWLKEAEARIRGKLTEGPVMI